MTVRASGDHVQDAAPVATADPVPWLPVLRDGLTHVYLRGGDSERRRAFATEIHRAGPFGRGAIVCLDASRDDALLRAALERWIAGAVSPGMVDPLTASSHGTLFIDRVADLSAATQRLLLVLAERLPAERRGSDAGWGGRLVVGCPTAPEAAVASGRLSSQLHDCLDKLRVDLGPVVHARRPKRAETHPGEEHAARSLCG